MAALLRLLTRVHRKCSSASSAWCIAEALHAREVLPATATYHLSPSDNDLEKRNKRKINPAHRKDTLRPSANLLFESVAASYQQRAIAVVLTGTGSDGSMGVRAIKKTGGTVIVEDEKTAEFSGMPSSAIHTKCVDFILPLDEIAPALVTLVMKGETA